MELNFKYPRDKEYVNSTIIRPKSDNHTSHLQKIAKFRQFWGIFGSFWPPRRNNVMEPHKEFNLSVP